MNIKKNKSSRRTSMILEHLEGTLIADLRSLKVCASTPIKQNSDLGSLNYTLFLVGLIGCETLGRYVFGADLDRKNQNVASDIGGYINRFIEQYFPNRDQYKSISKILSDYLRHILVHGFAPRKDGYPFDLHLVISKDGKDLPPLALEKNGRLLIELDGISFINRILKAFERIKSDSLTDTQLASRIIAAEDYCKSLSPPKEVLNQFVAAYPKLKKP